MDKLNLSEISGIKDSEVNLLIIGKSFHYNGQLDLARSIYKKIISNNSLNLDAWFLLGTSELQCNNPHLAIEAFNSALKIDPSNHLIYFNLGCAYHNIRSFNDALSQFKKSILIEPNFAESYFGIANVLSDVKCLDEALENFDNVLALAPAHIPALFNRANTLVALNRPHEALLSYNKTIELAPNHIQALFNRANTLADLNRPHEALLSYDKVIELAPTHFKAILNRGNTLSTIKCYQKALNDYEKALQIQPEFAEAHLGKAFLLLLSGQYLDGWKLYEWRWKIQGESLSSNHPTAHLWTGVQSLVNKTILLKSEQGLGDTLQFCRYVSLVKNMGATTILEVPKQLVSLLSEMQGVDLLIENGQTCENIDFFCPLMSLPLTFSTTIDNIPFPTQYLYPNATKSQYWSKRLEHIQKFKVGLVWNGGKRHNQPRQDAINDRRNINLSLFSSKLNKVPVHFFSLQKGEPAENEILGNELNYWPSGNFHNYANELSDFSDTAGLISNLDLVIGVDTSTIHLSLAMGKPTWVLNRFDNCWRWLEERQDSPWYKSARLYRQKNYSDWDTVLDQVAEDLTRLNIYDEKFQN